MYVWGSPLPYVAALSLFWHVCFPMIQLFAVHAKNLLLVPALLPQLASRGTNSLTGMLDVMLFPVFTCTYARFIRPSSDA